MSENRDVREEVNTLLGVGETHKTVSGKVIEIKPLVLRKYLSVFADVLTVLGNIVDRYPDLDLTDIKVSDFAEISKEFPDLISIIAKLIDIEPEDLLDGCDMVDISEIFVKILKVNKYERLVKNFGMAKEMILKMKSLPQEGQSPSPR